MFGADQDYLNVDSPMDETAITLDDLLRIPIYRLFYKDRSPFSIEKIVCAAHQWREKKYAEPGDVLDRVINMADANPDPKTVVDAVRKAVHDIRTEGVEWYECPQCTTRAI